MDKERPAQFYADETRVIVQNGSMIHSFRLLKDCPKIRKETTKIAKIGLARIAAGEQADPEEIVCLVLDEKNGDQIYRCGGPGEFEPQEGKFNYWVTDITHRDPTAPKLTEVRDAWEFNYQLYPKTLKDFARDSVVEDSLFEIDLSEVEPTEDEIAEELKKLLNNEYSSETKEETEERTERETTRDMPLIEDQLRKKLGDTLPKKKKKKDASKESPKEASQNPYPLFQFEKEDKQEGDEENLS